MVILMRFLFAIVFSIDVYMYLLAASHLLILPKLRIPQESELKISSHPPVGGATPSLGIAR